MYEVAGAKAEPGDGPATLAWRRPPARRMMAVPSRTSADQSGPRDPPLPGVRPGMADIVLINPRFEVSYWGMEHALPFLGKRANLPVACLPLLAALDARGAHRHPDGRERRGDQLRAVRPADIVGVTGMSVQRFRMKEILAELKRRGCFTVVGGPLVTVQEDYFEGVADVIFIGEAEETWPRFLGEWKHRLHQYRYEQAEKSDMSKVPTPAVRPAQDAALRLREPPVLARLPVPVRVLRHHRHLRPPPPAQDLRAGDQGAGCALGPEDADRLHRRRQPDRQQEGDQAGPPRRDGLAGRGAGIRSPSSPRRRSTWPTTPS